MSLDHQTIVDCIHDGPIIHVPLHIEVQPKTQKKDESKGKELSKRNIVDPSPFFSYIFHMLSWG